MPLCQFLAWLSEGSKATTQWLHFQVMCWLAFYLEQGTWMQGSSTDPLQAPIPSANRRKRRYSKLLQEAVAKEAAEGGHGRSARAVLENMSHFQRKRCKLAAKSANKWVDGRLARYWDACKQTCRTPGLSVFGVAADQTRAGQRDMLFSCLYLTEVRKACWLPPQDTGSVGGWALEGAWGDAAKCFAASSQTRLPHRRKHATNTLKPHFARGISKQNVRAKKKTRRDRRDEHATNTVF